MATLAERSLDGSRLDPRDVTGAAVVTAVTLALATAAFLLIGPLRFALYAPGLDLVFNTVAAVASIAVATLSFTRYREQGGVAGLLEASAFTVLATASIANTLAIVTGLDDVVGLTLADPGQLPLYFWAAARLLSALLLAAGAARAVSARVEAFGRPRLVLILPTVILGLVFALTWAARSSIPVLVDPATLRELADESLSRAPLPGPNPGIVLLDGLAAALLLVAAFGYATGRQRLAGVPRGYLVVGLVVAAFSQLHFILYPAVYSGLVSTGDALRVAFYLVLLVGIQAATRADLKALRAANGRLRLLAAAEADRTAIAERARLARELHDGLAQDLWTMKIEVDRLRADLGPLDPATDAQYDRVRGTVDTALAEARDAVAALRTGFDAGLSFADELPRRLDAFAESTGYPVDLEFDPAVNLPGVFAAEVLRIIDEALRNVQRHADATRIRVVVAVVGTGLLVSVDDNGRGFHPTTDYGHGIIGMIERATLLGGRLEIRSAPGDGTSVRLHLPSMTWAT